MEDSSASSVFQDRRRDYFGKFRFACKVMGMSLERNNSMAYRVYSLLFTFMPMFIYTLIRVLELFLNDDIPISFETIWFPYLLVVVFSKSIVFARNRDKLAKILDKLEHEPYLPNPSRGNEVEEENLQKNCMNIIKTQSIIYVGVAIVVMTATATESLINRKITEDYHDWQFPYGQSALLNLTRSPNYELWWFYENFSAYILTIRFIIIDTVVAAILTYISFQFKMLQYNIRRIVEISYKEMLMKTGNLQDSDETSSVDASVVPWKYLKKSLKRTIDYHLAILSVAAETEEAFNGFLLFSFLNSLGLLGVLVGQTVLLTRAATVFVCGQLVASCFWGQQLMDESQEVGRAAFEANFLGADLRFQKSLAMIIRRSQNPVVITAGKFAVVCLETFTWVLRAGYSASTVLSQM